MTKGEYMLASILPGLREVRTPLAVGYLWLLNLWLWWGNKLPRQAPEDSEWSAASRIFELSGWLGKGATVAAVSFAAYLLGSLILLPYTPSRFGPVTGYPFKSDEWQFLYGHMFLKGSPTRMKNPIYRLFYRLNVALTDLATAIASRILGSAARSFIATTRELAAEVNESENDTLQLVTKNREDLRTRLLVADKELFGEYDRLSAESQFRINVALPLLLAIMTVLVTADLRYWWTLVIVLPMTGIFVAQGIVRDFEAITVLMRATIVGKIRPPYLMKKDGKDAADSFV